jgi:hypothetical protein
MVAGKKARKGMMYQAVRGTTRMARKSVSSGVRGIWCRPWVVETEKPLA